MGWQNRLLVAWVLIFVLTAPTVSASFFNYVKNPFKVIKAISNAIAPDIKLIHDIKLPDQIDGKVEVTVDFGTPTLSHLERSGNLLATVINGNIDKIITLKEELFNEMKESKEFIIELHNRIEKSTKEIIVVSEYALANLISKVGGEVRVVVKEGVLAVQELIVGSVVHIRDSVVNIFDSACDILLRTLLILFGEQANFLFAVINMCVFVSLLISISYFVMMIFLINPNPVPWHTLLNSILQFFVRVSALFLTLYAVRLLSVLMTHPRYEVSEVDVKISLLSGRVLLLEQQDRVTIANLKALEDRVAKVEAYLKDCRCVEDTLTVGTIYAQTVVLRGNVEFYFQVEINTLVLRNGMHRFAFPPGQNMDLNSDILTVNTVNARRIMLQGEEKYNLQVEHGFFVIRNGRKRYAFFPETSMDFPTLQHHNTHEEL